MSAVATSGVADTGVLFGELMPSFAMRLSLLSAFVVLKTRDSFKMFWKPARSMEAFASLITIGFVVTQMVNLISLGNGSDEILVGESMDLPPVLLERQSSVPVRQVAVPHGAVFDQVGITYEPLQELDSDRVLYESHEGFHTVEDSKENR